MRRHELEKTRFSVRFDVSTDPDYKWVAMRTLKGQSRTQDQPIFYIKEQLSHGPGEDRYIITGLPIAGAEANHEEYVSLSDLIETVKFLQSKPS
jgi:hypothetical protein